MADWIKTGENPKAAGTVTYGVEGQAVGFSLDSAGNAVFAGNATVSGQLFAGTMSALGVWTPAVNGLVAATFDPRMVNSQSAVTNGTIYLAEVFPVSAGPVTRILWGIQAAGVGPVAGQSWVGLVDPAGAVIASAGVDASVTSTGLISTTISSQALTPGAAYRLALLFNAATPPTLYKATGLGSLINAGIALPANYLHATNGGGATVLPGSFTLSGNVSSTNAFWGALAP